MGADVIHTGHPAEAFGYYDQAIVICREVGHRRGEADILTRLAEAHAASGQYDNARGAWRQALTLKHAARDVTESAS